MAKSRDTWRFLGKHVANRTRDKSQKNKKPPTQDSFQTVSINGVFFLWDIYTEVKYEHRKVNPFSETTPLIVANIYSCIMSAKNRTENNFIVLKTSSVALWPDSPCRSSQQCGLLSALIIWLFQSIIPGTQWVAFWMIPFTEHSAVDAQPHCPSHAVLCLWFTVAARSPGVTQSDEQMLL